jgi:ADP-heptose:LPS heptosyltransferase
LQLKNYIKNYLEFGLFIFLKRIFPKNNTNTRILLLINTGYIGDLVVSSVLLENPQIFNGYKKVKFLVREEYLTLFSKYMGNVEFIGYNYKKYKYSLIYKIKHLMKLRKEGVETCINLTAARGILNEEITHLSGAKRTLALNSSDIYLGKKLVRYFNHQYTDIIAKEVLNEYDKHFELMKYLVRENNNFSFNRGITFNEVYFSKISKFNKYIPFVVIAPYSSEGNRDWKEEYFIKVIDYLRKNNRIILIGSSLQKKKLLELKGEKERVDVLAGDLELFEIPILLKKAKLFIGLDSGATHMALKVGTPLLAIIGGGEFGRFLPYRESEKAKYLYHRMDCFLCHWKCDKKEEFCLTNINSKYVIRIINKFL